LEGEQNESKQKLTRSQHEDPNSLKFLREQNERLEKTQATISEDLRARGETAKSMQERLTEYEQKLADLTVKYDEYKKACVKL